MNNHFCHEQLWTLLVENGIVQQDGSIEFGFIGREKIRIKTE